ncbi:MAG: hypothetical protein II404_13565 [Prevotella sp.]|nr:hypothetical protein [Prevotella sp.]
MMKRTMQRVVKRSLLWVLLLMSTTAYAQDVSYQIISEKDTTVSITINGIKLGSRDIHRYMYSFQSVDAEGLPVNVSAAVWVPSEIYNGSVPCDGVVLYNHFTHLKATERVSVVGEQLCNAILSSPMKPNYVFVISDYLGFGLTENRPQAYLCGKTNSRNSLDGLLAARKLMNDYHIPQGKYLFNMGYSQGGTESMFAARLCDEEYKDKGITFDKTFSGGGPLDFQKVYTEMVRIGRTSIPSAVVLMLVSLNENYHMGLNYKEVFQDPIASHIDDWILSKDYTEAELRKMIGSDSLKHFLQPAYMDMESEPAKALLKKLKEISLTTDWNPDVTQHYYIEHSRHDDYVPIQSSRTIFSWMREKGFTTSLVPGKTNLQTNTAVFKLGHEASAVVWLIQTAAAIQAWPVLYYEGELNRYYNDLVKDLNLLKAIKLLESMGIDLRKLFRNQEKKEVQALLKELKDGHGQLRRSGFSDVMDILSQLSEILAKVDLTLQDFVEMLDDSGITIPDLIEAYDYLTKDPAKEQEGGRSPAAATYLIRHYEQVMAAWLLTGGIDVQYDKWGWNNLNNEE